MPQPPESPLASRLRDLERALRDLLESEPAVNSAWSELTEAGAELSLVLRCELPEPAQPAVEGRRTRQTSPPEFRLVAEDVALLRSLGIDPTRKAPRGRRRARSHGAAPDGPATGPTEGPSNQISETLRPASSRSRR